MKKRAPKICIATLLCIMAAAMTFFLPIDRSEATAQARRKSMTVEEIVEQAKQLSLEDQIELMNSLRQLLGERLMEIDPALAAGFESVEQEELVRVNRLLNRGSFEGFLEVRGGGAYFSFTTLTNDYNREPSISLERWNLTTGFYGANFGYVLPLDSKPIRSVGMDLVPEYLLMEDVHVLKGYLRQNRAPKQPELRPGLTYLIRWVGFDEADQLVALEVLEKDPYGITFAWKIMKEFPIPRKK